MHILNKLAYALAIILAMILATSPAAANKDFPVKGMVLLDRPLEYGEYFWDETDIPAGEVTIVADLAADQLYIYRGGYELARATFIQGDYETPTIAGAYTILEKDEDHYSSTYDRAPMPFNLRLTWSGYAIHGTAQVSDDYATHGCLGLPVEFAKILFKHTKVGTRVLITRRWQPSLYW